MCPQNVIMGGDASDDLQNKAKIYGAELRPQVGSLDQLDCSSSYYIKNPPNWRVFMIIG